MNKKRQTQKKLLLKNYKKICQIAKNLHDVELEGGIDKLVLNIFLKRGYGDSIEQVEKNQYRLNFDLEQPDLVGVEDITNICNERGIYDQNIIDQIIDNLEHGQTTNNHTLGMLEDCFGKYVDDFDKYNYLSSSKTNWETGKVEEVIWYDKPLYNIDVWDNWAYSELAPSKHIDSDLIIELQTINDFGIKALFSGEYFENFQFTIDGTLDGAVKFSFEVLNNLIYAIKKFRNVALPAFKTIELAVEDYELRSQELAMDLLRDDIDDLIESNNLIISDDINKIKFQKIVKIENGNLVTDRQAKVPLKDARTALLKFMEGIDIVGDYIGEYKVAKIINIKDNFLIRIGCHLIRIDDELKSQLI